MSCARWAAGAGALGELLCDGERECVCWRERERECEVALCDGAPAGLVDGDTDTVALPPAPGDGVTLTLAGGDGDSDGDGDTGEHSGGDTQPG